MGKFLVLSSLVQFCCFICRESADDLIKIKCINNINFWPHWLVLMWVCYVFCMYCVILWMLLSFLSRIIVNNCFSISGLFQYGVFRYMMAQCGLHRVRSVALCPHLSATPAQWDSTWRTLGNSLLVTTCPSLHFTTV